MMEYWKNGVLKNRCTGVLARTCAGEDACTPYEQSFPIIPTFQPARRLVHRSRIRESGSLGVGGSFVYFFFT